MNMPITEEGKVNFTTTLFALIRENLSIKMRPAEEMDQADRELRHTLNKLWPLQAKKIIDKLIPPNDGMNTRLFSNLPGCCMLFMCHYCINIYHAILYYINYNYLITRC